MLILTAMISLGKSNKICGNIFLFRICLKMITWKEYLARCHIHDYIGLAPGQVITSDQKYRVAKLATEVTHGMEEVRYANRFALEHVLHPADVVCPSHMDTDEHRVRCKLEAMKVGLHFGDEVRSDRC